MADNIAGNPSTTAGQRQAGRSPSPPPLPTLSTNSNNKHDAALTFTPTLDTETNPLNITNESNFSLSNIDLKELGSQISTKNIEYESPKNITANLSINTHLEGENKDDSDELEYTDADLDEVLGSYDDNEDGNNKKNSFEKKSVLDDSSENKKASSNIESSNNNSQKEAYPDYEICEINQLVVPEDKSSLRNKIVTPVNTPTNPDVCENHYLPMSPRKAVANIEPPHIAIIKSMTAFCEDHHEDNPYVEMSQGGIESAFSKEETQAYEIVCVSSGKVEPVYMELNNVSVKNAFSESDLNKSNTQPNTDENNFSDDKVNTVPKSILRKQKSDSKLAVKSLMRTDVKSPLPDILMASQNKEFTEKSDSSDADDECSKDFSLQKAYSRFSLSDTFRPASYYLRSKNMLNDLHDSSDSEILSPPPIPMSPPPIEELEVSDSSLSHGKIEDPIKAIINISQSELPERKSTSLMDYGNTPSMYDTIFKGERVKRNRISLPDNEKPSRFYKESDSNQRSSLDLKLVPPSYKTSGNADTDSLLSYNADRGSSRMSIESDISSKFDISTVGGYQLEERPQSVITTDTMSLNESEDFVKLRHEHRLSDIELEKMLKRRPLSEESCFEIESLDQNLHNHDINLDDYVNQLQSGNTFGIENLYPFKAYDDDYTLDKKTLSYLNDRVAAIKEEVQYENVNLNERSRSRNSNGSNTISDPDTVSTFQTVYSLQKSSASSTRESPFNPKYEKGYSSRSDSRSSLPIQTNINSSPQIQETPCHTRHASFEQPTISYYSKNTSPTDNDASIMKNLNRYKNQKDSINKVNIMEMNKMKSSKSAENLHHSDATPKFSSNLIFHNRDNSGEQSAPYYYSDLSSQDNLNLSGSSVTSYNKNILSVSNKLNNQRRRGPVARKCDISHIHNPIHSSTMYNDAVGQDDSQNLIAAAVRCVSVEFLSAADKIADIDNKNIYESTTLKQQKTRDSASAHSSVSKNIYPTNNDKISSFENFDESSSSHNKSWEEIIHNVVSPLQNRSMNQSISNAESNQISHPNIISNNLGRISDIPENTSICETNRSVSITKNLEPNKSTSNKSTYDGEMMWDEDALWRENLRRVSHRHARSLDHLDCLNSIENISGRCSVDLKTMLVSSKNLTDTNNRHTKITRDVTYVNDNVKTQRNATLKRKQHKKMSNKSHLLPQVTDAANENDVYVQLALDTDKKTQFHDTLDDGVYEQLTVETKSEKNNFEENSTNGDGFFLLEDDSKSEIRKKFEIDREKLRQWDLMSSGLMKNESGSCVESDVNGGATEGGGSHNTSTPPGIALTFY